MSTNFVDVLVIGGGVIGLANPITPPPITNTSTKLVLIRYF